jgi:hypothetical protein
MRMEGPAQAVYGAVIHPVLRFANQATHALCGVLEVRRGL